MKSLEIYLTIDEIQLIMHSMLAAQSDPEHLTGIGTANFDTLLERVKSICDIHSKLMDKLLDRTDVLPWE